MHTFLLLLSVLLVVTAALVASIRSASENDYRFAPAAGLLAPGGFTFPTFNDLKAKFVALYTAVTTTAGGFLYQDPSLGTLDVGINVRIDPSSFKGTGFVDADGYLIPGTPIQADLTPVTAAAQVAVYVVAHATQIAGGNTDALLDAAVNQDIGLHTEGRWAKSAIEHNLGRALSADEIAAFGANARHLLVAY